MPPRGRHRRRDAGHVDAEQVRALDAGTIDLGFVRLPAPPRFQGLPVLEDELIALTPPGPSASRTWRQADFVLLARDVSPILHDHVVRVCGPLGFRPRVALETRDYITAMTLVESGVGVTILPASSLDRMRAGVRPLRLRTPAARWQVGAAWRRDNQNAALAGLLALLRKACDRPDRWERAPSAARPRDPRSPRNHDPRRG